MINNKSQRTLSQQQFVERLRAWAARADNEVAETYGANKQSWQGQASVLRSVAIVVASGDAARNTPVALRLQFIADRNKAQAAWEQETDAFMLAQHAGEVQGYELILNLLQDVEVDWNN